MAVVLTLSAPDRTTYDSINAILGVPEDYPDGLIVHAACEVDGEIQVTDVWETREHLDTFFETRLGKAIAETGMELPAPTIRETVNVFRR